MVTRKEIRFRDSDETPYGIAYLNKYIEREPTQPLHKILETIFEEHDRLTAIQVYYELANQNLLSEIEKLFKPTQLRSGYTEKNVRILLELWNTYLFNSGLKKILTTDEFLTTILKEAREKVNHDVAKTRAKKLEFDRLNE